MNVTGTGENAAATGDLDLNGAILAIHSPMARWFSTWTELADMSEYDRTFWEERWSQALREHGDRVAQRPPNAHLTAEVSDLRPGRALDAGCGHGSDTLIGHESPHLQEWVERGW